MCAFGLFYKRIPRGGHSFGTKEPEKGDRSVLFISQDRKEAVASILSVFSLLNLCRHCQASSRRSFDPGTIFCTFLQRKSSGVEAVVSSLKTQKCEASTRIDSYLEFTH